MKVLEDSAIQIARPMQYGLCVDVFVPPIYGYGHVVHDAGRRHASGVQLLRQRQNGRLDFVKEGRACQ